MNNYEVRITDRDGCNHSLHVTAHDYEVWTEGERQVTAVFYDEYDCKVDTICGDIYRIREMRDDPETAMRTAGEAAVDAFSSSDACAAFKSLSVDLGAVAQTLPDEKLDALEIWSTEAGVVFEDPNAGGSYSIRVERTEAGDVVVRLNPPDLSKAPAVTVVEARR